MNTAGDTELNRQGVVVARCTVERLMRKAGLRGLLRDKSPRTTRPAPETGRPTDLVDRDLTATRVNQLWVADITHVRTTAGWAYAAADSTDRRNTLTGRWSDGVRAKAEQVREYRGQIPSPGRPTVAWREDRVRFWAAIATGVLTDEASEAAGVSAPVGYRWFRHAGGVNPQLSTTVSGRYLSFAEHEALHAMTRAVTASLEAR